MFGNQFTSVLCQAKLRYDPIELDPEDMCRMASEQPQVRMELHCEWDKNRSISNVFPLVICLYLPQSQPFLFSFH